MDIKGMWQITVRTPEGEQTASLNLTEYGGVVLARVTMLQLHPALVDSSQRAGDGADGPIGSTELAGTLRGESIELHGSVRGPSGPTTLSLIGEISGDSISGTVRFGAHRQGTWSGVRV